MLVTSSPHDAPKNHRKSMKNYSQRSRQRNRPPGPVCVCYFAQALQEQYMHSSKLHYKTRSSYIIHIYHHISSCIFLIAPHIFRRSLGNMKLQNSTPPLPAPPGPKSAYFSYCVWVPPKRRWQDPEKKLFSLKKIICFKIALNLNIN